MCRIRYVDKQKTMSSGDGRSSSSTGGGDGDRDGGGHGSGFGNSDGRCDCRAGLVGVNWHSPLLSVTICHGHHHRHHHHHPTSLTPFSLRRAAAFSTLWKRHYFLQHSSIRKRSAPAPAPSRPWWRPGTRLRSCCMYPHALAHGVSMSQVRHFLQGAGVTSAFSCWRRGASLESRTNKPRQGRVAAGPGVLALGGRKDGQRGDIG